MSGIFKEENNFYQIDLSLAEWSTDEIHDTFHRSKTELSDVDFVAETHSDIILIEYKNANIPGAANPNAFIPTDDKAISTIARKYYDSCLYLDAIEKTKPRTYIYILEYPLGDSVTRKAIRNKIQSKLPFVLQTQPQIKKQLIKEFQVLSIAEWNADPTYGKFPLKRIGDAI